MIFQSLIGLGKPIGKVGEQGNQIYNAVNYNPTLSQIAGTALRQIVSQDVRAFVANVFDIYLDENVILGMHQHMPPSDKGWVHTDFAVVSFPKVSPNLDGMRVFTGDSGVNYSDDSKHRQPESIKTARSVACLYYIGNVPWQSGFGGETGVYLPDGKTLFKAIPPRNNSLFMFEISPISYHAFMGSSSLRRNSFIWWYHSDPGYLIHRHQRLAKYRADRGEDPWDRWTDTNVEKFETPVFYLDESNSKNVG
ncbi:MAG: 2OG-Fe(II) oxygenase [Pirellula sp.]